MSYFHSLHRSSFLKPCTLDRQRSTTAELVRIVRRVATMDGFQFEKFCDYLNRYQLARTALFSSKPDGWEHIYRLSWQCNAIRACVVGFQCQTIAELCSEIVNLLN